MVTRAYCKTVCFVNRLQPRIPNQVTGTRRRKSRIRDREMEAWKRWLSFHSFIPTATLLVTFQFLSKNWKNILSVVPTFHNPFFNFVFFFTVAEALAWIHCRAPQPLWGAEEGEWCPACKESCGQQAHYCGAARWAKGGGQGLGHNTVPACLWYQVGTQTTGCDLLMFSH